MDEEIEEGELDIDTALSTVEGIGWCGLSRMERHQEWTMFYLIQKAPACSSSASLTLFGEEKLPEQWKQGLICKILKKGNVQQFGNWRGVTSLTIDSMWRIKRVCGIPDKLIRLVKVMYDGFKCAVIDEGEEIPLGYQCEARMLHVGIRWDFTRLLEDIGYVDDLLLLTLRAGPMQEKQPG